MIPWLPEPVLSLGPLRLPAFPLAVGAGVLAGFEVAVRRAPRFGCQRRAAARLAVAALAAGFAGSHLFAHAVYRPLELLADPARALAPWGPMSSFGGVLGGWLGAHALLRRQGLPPAARARRLDLLAFALPFGWAPGRAGCALAHDHPGVRSDAFLAVRFPDGPRLDRGLLEMLLALVLAGLFLGLGRRPRPPGLFLGLLLALYGLARLALDALRVCEPRLLGWTAGQALALACLAAGLARLAGSSRAARGGVAAQPAREGVGHVEGRREEVDAR